jgi:hypothetical protein
MGVMNGEFLNGENNFLSNVWGGIEQGFHGIVVTGERSVSVNREREVHCVLLLVRQNFLPLHGFWEAVMILL